MMSLLAIFALPICASVSFGLALTLLGCHLAARDRAMQTMCMGQGASLGVIFSLGVGLAMGLHDEVSSVVSYVGGFVFAGMSFLISERVIEGKDSSRNTHFCALFLTLMACSHLATSLFPALENHMVQRYFGDLATMGEEQAWTALIVALVLCVMLVKNTVSLSRNSFDAAILGISNKRALIIFQIICIIAVALGVQLMGFLFTAACLFIPTSILSRRRNSYLSKHFALCAVSVVSGVLGGFLLSLYYSNLPTVACAVIITVLTSLACSVSVRS